MPRNEPCCPACGQPYTASGTVVVTRTYGERTARLCAACVARVVDVLNGVPLVRKAATS